MKASASSGMRLDWSEVDALVVSGVERAGFFWIEREIAEALTGTHFSWAQDGRELRTQKSWYYR
jgi:hypothetical protein